MPTAHQSAQEETVTRELLIRASGFETRLLVDYILENWSAVREAAKTSLYLGSVSIVLNKREMSQK